MERSYVLSVIARTFDSCTTSRMPSFCIELSVLYRVVCDASVSCRICFGVIGPFRETSIIILSFSGFPMQSWISASSNVMAGRSPCAYMNVSKMVTFLLRECFWKGGPGVGPAEDRAVDLGAGDGRLHQFRVHVLVCVDHADDLDVSLLTGLLEFLKVLASESDYAEVS